MTDQDSVSEAGKADRPGGLVPKEFCGKLSGLYGREVEEDVEAAVPQDKRAALSLLARRLIQ